MTDNLKLEINIHEEDLWYNIGGKDRKLRGKHMWHMYYKTNEQTNIITTAGRDFYFMNMPAFSMN